MSQWFFSFQSRDCFQDFRRGISRVSQVNYCQRWRNLDRDGGTFARICAGQSRPVRIRASVHCIWCTCFSKPSISSCIFVTILTKFTDGYSSETARYLTLRFLLDFVYFTIKMDDNSPREIVSVEQLTSLRSILSSKDVQFHLTPSQIVLLIRLALG